MSPNEVTAGFRALLLIMVMTAAGIGGWFILRPAMTAGAVPGVARGDAPTPGILHLVFQAGDCPESLAQIRRLGREGLEAGFAVDGILVNSSRLRGELDIVREHGGFAFPVRADPWGRITRRVRSLGFESTPVVLVTDRAGRLRTTLPAETLDSYRNEREMISHVERLLEADT